MKRLASPKVVASRAHHRTRSKPQGRLAMDHVGMDLVKSESQIAILTEDGELIEMRIRTERHRLGEVFRRRPESKILVEASTESEWVARCLEELGHEVIVADPNYAPIYAHRTRRVKTDRRDARALAQACRLGAYRPAHQQRARFALRAKMRWRQQSRSVMPVIVCIMKLRADTTAPVRHDRGRGGTSHRRTE